MNEGNAMQSHEKLYINAVLWIKDTWMQSNERGQLSAILLMKII